MDAMQRQHEDLPWLEPGSSIALWIESMVLAGERAESILIGPALGAEASGDLRQTPRGSSILRFAL